MQVNLNKETSNNLSTLRFFGFIEILFLINIKFYALEIMHFGFYLTNSECSAYLPVDHSLVSFSVSFLVYSYL